MTQELNPVLMDLAKWKLSGEAEKQAFVPADAAAAAGGAPPMDPAAMGGAPPMDPAAMGGAPPMDPMAMGGAPPMDPMAMGGAPPMAPPAAAPPAPGGAPGAPGAAAKPKIDPTFIYMELSRVRKLITHFMRQTGIELPPDILDDGAVAQQLNGTPPESAALGQEPPPPPGPPEGGAGLPGLGGASAVNPIEAAGGGEKMGSLNPIFQAITTPDKKPDFLSLDQRINALASLSRSHAGGR
jgi:hypothetical protein